jgi:hypothetical protein
MKRIGAAIAVSAVVSASAAHVPRTVACEPDNGGITLPTGFCATTFADYAGVARHIAVSSRGQLFVALGNATGNGTSKIAQMRPENGAPGLLILTDRNRDGRSDQEQRIAVPEPATGIALSRTHAMAVLAQAVEQRDPRARQLWFDVTTVAAADISTAEAALIVKRIRQVGVERILYGSDAAAGSNLRPRDGWAAFRNLPLTDNETARIAGNVAPYMQ